MSDTKAGPSSPGWVTASIVSNGGWPFSLRMRRGIENQGITYTISGDESQHLHEDAVLGYLATTDDELAAGADPLRLHVVVRSRMDAFLNRIPGPWRTLQAFHFDGEWRLVRADSEEFYNVAGVPAPIRRLDELAMVDTAQGRVPWLSVQLAEYLRQTFGEQAENMADEWLQGEARRERERLQQGSFGWGNWALPGWVLPWQPDPARPAFACPPAMALFILAVWHFELRPELARVAAWRARAERLRPALTHAAQAQLLAFVGSQSPRVHERNGQPIATYTLHDGAEVSVRLEGSADAAMDAATMQNLIDRGRLARLDVAHLRALDLIMNELAARLADGDMPADGVPRLELPKGKPLAERLRLGASGAKGAEADAALDYLSRIELTDGRGSLARLIAAPEARAHAPGRAGAWLVTPGELIRPTMAQNQPLNQRRWRQFVPWLDSFPDDSWLNPRQRASLGYLALRTAVFWREAAGRDHGKRWLNTPGLALTPDVLDTLTDGLDRDRTIRELERAGWWSIEGELLLPGERLPRFMRDLHRAAEHAAGKAHPRKRRRK